MFWDGWIINFNGLVNYWTHEFMLELHEALSYESIYLKKKLFDDIQN